MESGQLRKLLTLEAPTSVQNVYGEDTAAAWTFVATVWGSIKTLNGRQLALAQANTITATSTHVVTIRYRTGLLPTHRITYAQQSGPVLADLTGSQFAALTGPQFAALPSESSTPPRHFSIDAIADEFERHRELQLTVTEVRA